MRCGLNNAPYISMVILVARLSDGVVLQYVPVCIREETIDPVELTLCFL